ncbi:MAG: TatD family hydrolase [Lachnospiraceae bacterium]|nr:TatD family hydrolase [Lachnospiraceae bacterium]
MEIRYTDIGLNLFNDQFRGKENTVIDNAYAAGVRVIITGSSLHSSLCAAEFCAGSRKEKVYFTAGIHPHDAKSCDKAALEKIKEIIQANKERIVAVGECGLDYDRMFSPKDIQLKAFEEQIEVAEWSGLPLFLHERDAADDFIRILEKHRDVAKRAVVHCFTGNRDTAQAYLSLGCLIGITGWVCDKRRNAALVDALDIIPAESLMAETDGPYLLPRGIKGLKNPNVSENIVYVVKKMAEIKSADEESLRRQILENTERFFSFR